MIYWHLWSGLLSLWQAGHELHYWLYFSSSECRIAFTPSDSVFQMPLEWTLPPRRSHQGSTAATTPRSRARTFRTAPSSPSHTAVAAWLASSVGTLSRWVPDSLTWPFNCILSNLAGHVVLVIPLKHVHLITLSKKTRTLLCLHLRLLPARRLPAWLSAASSLAKPWSSPAWPSWWRVSTGSWAWPTPPSQWPKWSRCLTPPWRPSCCLRMSFLSTSAGGSWAGNSRIGRQNSPPHTWKALILIAATIYSSKLWLLASAPLLVIG